MANAPATYQRLMEEVIIFSRNYDDHLQHLDLVFFQRIADARLKLAPDKCSLFKRKVNYVEHVVYKKGISRHGRQGD